MDAAQKLLKNIAILTAIALLLSTVGFAVTPTLVVTPNPVPIGATRQSDPVSVTSSDGTTPITFAIGPPTYTGADSSWLQVSPSGTAATPASLTFSARNIVLSAALHTAYVDLTPTSPSGTPVRITVTYDTSGTGISTTLTASTTNVSLTNTIATANVNITNASASAVGVGVTSAVTSGSTNWLSASLNSISISAAGTAILTIGASQSGLAAAIYQGTVTLTPFDGTTALTINVTFTVGSGSGGAWSVNPSSIPWTFTTNLGTYPSQAVTVNVTSATSNYNVVTTQTGSVQWLLVAAGGQPAGTGAIAIPVGSPFTLSVGTAANNLTQGTYTGQANITDQNGIQYATVTVTLTVNGGNSSGLTLTPSSVSFTSVLNGAQQSQVISVTSGTGGTLILGGCNALLWLTCTLPSSTTLFPNVGSAFTIYVNPSAAGLAATTYTSTVQIQVGSQTGTVNVSLSLGGGGTGTTAVAPTSLTFAYEYGTNTSFVARQKLVITGPAGPWSSTKSITSPSGGTWLNLSPSSGTALPDPSLDATTPAATPIVSVDPTGLAVGDYGGSITITTPGGTQIIQVLLHVVSSTIILPNPSGALIFTARSGPPKPIPQGLFWSDSDSALNIDSSPVTATANNPWITLSGLTPGTVTVQVDQTGLSTGVYSGSISLTQTGAANSPTTVPILLVVNGGTSGPLTFSQNPIAFTSVNGVTTPSPAALTVSSASAASFVASIAYTSGSGTWLTVSPLSGSTPANLTVSATPGNLAAGSYGATISFTANGVVQTVGVKLTVSASGGGTTGNVTVSPTTLSFAALLGSNPAAQSLTVSSAAGAAGVSFTTQVTVGSGWLSTSANASNTTPVSFTVTVGSSTLPANTYSGNILITPSGGTPVNIPVTLTITASGSVSVTPTAITFNYRLGDSAPAAQPLTVSGVGAFTATPTSTGNWLTVSPATGTAPGTVNVSINGASLANLTTGVPADTGTILVAGTGGASGSTTVTVTLNVTSPLPTLSRVTNAASYASGSVSPGEIITLFGNDPTHPIGPATPAFLALDANGNVATSIGGVQVTVAGYNCPMIYASASQVSAVVPYEAKLYANATVLVKFLGQGSNGVPVTVATTVPGVFTTNTSGTGPGAILNSDLSLNSATNPATRGDIVVIYMTGEGETSPGGVTGKVTTVASPPQPLTPGPLLRPSVTIGDQPASWTFAGEAPGLVSGVMQMNVVVPTNIAAGDQPIVVTIGGNPSQPRVTVSVK